MIIIHRQKRNASKNLCPLNLIYSSHSPISLILPFPHHTNCNTLKSHKVPFYAFVWLFVCTFFQFLYKTLFRSFLTSQWGNEPNYDLTNFSQFCEFLKEKERNKLFINIMILVALFCFLIRFFFKPSYYSKLIYKILNLPFYHNKIRCHVLMEIFSQVNLYISKSKIYYRCCALLGNIKLYIINIRKYYVIRKNIQRF